jgi:hypothetical protein
MNIVVFCVEKNSNTVLFDILELCDDKNTIALFIQLMIFIYIPAVCENKNKRLTWFMYYLGLNQFVVFEEKNFQSYSHSQAMSYLDF